MISRRVTLERERSRIFVAVVGAPLAAVATGCGMIAFLPFSAPLALAIGVHSIVPLWAVLTCSLPLLASMRIAWLLCGSMFVVPMIALWMRHAGMLA